MNTKILLFFLILFSSQIFSQGLVLNDEMKSLKQAVGLVYRKGTELHIKTKLKEEIIYNDVVFDSAKENNDLVQSYTFEKLFFSKYVLLKKKNNLGTVWLLISTTDSRSTELDAEPVFSPSGKRFAVVSGKLHNEFTPEAITVFSKSKMGWRQEYKSDAAALDAYGKIKWTNENRISAEKYSWAKTKNGEPEKTETIFVYETPRWRKIGK